MPFERPSCGSQRYAVIITSSEAQRLHAASLMSEPTRVFGFMMVDDEECSLVVEGDGEVEASCVGLVS